MKREDAVALWRAHNDDESLFKHALAVEATMRAFAGKSGNDPDRWGLVGLVHDLDWQRYPDRHCAKTAEILAEAQWPEDMIRAVRSHGWKHCDDTEPRHYMEKVLWTIDELTGLVHACALVRPNRSIGDMEYKSVKKKWGAKGFAAGVNREQIEEGAAMLGMSVEEVVTVTIEAMRGVAAELGLKGTNG
jgi:predicted hydrolase (HD superfamily)